MSAELVARVSDVPPGAVLRVEVRGRPVVLVNLGDAGFRAIDAVCSHAQYYLDEGDVDVDEETIECPKHGSIFDLNSGRPRSLPAITPVGVYPVKVVGNDIVIEVSE